LIEFPHRGTLFLVLKPMKTSKFSNPKIYDDISVTNISTREAHSHRGIHGGCAYFKRSANSRSLCRYRRNNVMTSQYAGGRDMKSESVKQSDVEVQIWDGEEEVLRIRFPLLQMRIRVVDFVSLAQGALLTDSIIDFYLNHIVAHMLPDHVTSQIHILPSKLWHRLTTSANPFEEINVGNSDSIAPFSKEYRTYVNFWFEQVDIFDADFLVIPVIERQHWMLAIVCSPSMSIRKSVANDSRRSMSSPLIIVFDSQQDRDSKIIENFIVDTIRQFLRYVFDRRIKQNEREVFQAEMFKCIIPSNLPQQENNVDCGIFILEYARCFLLNQPPLECLSNGTFDFAVMYPQFRVKNRRNEIQKAILSLCVNAQMWRSLVETVEVDPKDLSKEVLEKVEELCATSY
uniref:Ubiquitin-like protease family profile domain-containing protein n=3 Tax=Parascaris univalens TaxID=6257 RepID=A0A914ZKP0_PARUN